MGWIILAVTVVLGLYMAWNIGANDAANSMADAVGAKAISIKWAIILCAICELAGAVLVGSDVTNTVRKGIVSPEAISSLPGLEQGEAAAIMALGMACALLAAALWLNAATWFGMPVSTTHSIVGAVTGFGIVAAGWRAVEWGTMGKVVASWVISPVVGGAIAFVLFLIVSRTVLGSRRPAKAAVRVMPYIVWFIFTITAMATVYKGLKHLSRKVEWLSGSGGLVLSVGVGVVAALIWRSLIARRMRDKTDLPLPEQLAAVERVFAPLVVVTSCAIAFAHGANDVANAVGPLAAVVDILRSGTVSMTVHVPAWVLAVGGVGIVLGLATFGYRVMITVGTKITQLTPSRGVCADVAACATVLACTRLGLPISTTHTLVGAIIGVGLARGLGAVNRDVLKSVFGSWLITVPVAAVLTVILFLLGKFFLLDYIIQAMPQPGA